MNGLLSDDNPDFYTEYYLVDRVIQLFLQLDWTSGIRITYDLPLGLGAGKYLYVLIALDDDVNQIYDDLSDITIEDNFPPVITQYSANMTVEIGYTDLEYRWTATDDDPDTYTIDLVGTGNIVGSTTWTSGTQVIFDITEGLEKGYHQFMINFTDTSGNYV